MKDVVQANLLAMRSPAVGKGEIFNVATGRKVSLLDLLETLKKITGSKLVPQFKDARAGDIKHSLADISKIRKGLGYEPKFDLEYGLRAIVEAG